MEYETLAPTYPVRYIRIVPVLVKAAGRPIALRLSVGDVYQVALAGAISSSVGNEMPV